MRSVAFHAASDWLCMGACPCFLDGCEDGTAREHSFQASLSCLLSGGRAGRHCWGLGRRVERTPRGWWVQIIFRSVNKLLMDTATSEYLFCCDFFQDDTVFTHLFAPTLTVVEAAFSSQLQVPSPASCSASCRVS